MILMRAELAADLDRPDALHTALQTAIELEHATIPVYLYALYSLEPGRNAVVADILQSVVREEMTHMGLAANLLNAVGGSPVIARPGFRPRLSRPATGDGRRRSRGPAGPAEPGPGRERVHADRGAGGSARLPQRVGCRDRPADHRGVLRGDRRPAPHDGIRGVRRRPGAAGDARTRSGGADRDHGPGQCARGDPHHRRGGRGDPAVPARQGGRARPLLPVRRDQAPSPTGSQSRSAARAPPDQLFSYTGSPVEIEPPESGRCAATRGCTPTPRDRRPTSPTRRSTTPTPRYSRACTSPSTAGPTTSSARSD